MAAKKKAAPRKRDGGTAPPKGTGRGPRDGGTAPPKGTGRGPAKKK